MSTIKSRYIWILIALVMLFVTSAQGKNSANGYGLMDSLTLSYDGYRLTGVSEAATDYDVSGSFEYKRARGSQYVYNVNGSLVADKSRGIAYITYDANNNPSRIYFTNGNVTKYLYSAAGQKLRAVHYTAMPYITRTFGVQPPELAQSQILCADSADYLLGGSLVMQDGKIDKLLFDGGYARAMETGSTTDRFLFYYYNKDHLGNNREVVDAKARFHQVTSYYPFGAPYADAAVLLGTDHQPYKYNGKELDLMHGLNTYDYGARQYDPILARWDRVDPLAEKYYEVSPYAYCGNNPINRIDPNGKDIWDIDAMGYIEQTETNEYDMIRMYNNGQDNRMSLLFEYGTISYHAIKNEGLEYDLFKINGDSNGRSIFEMVAQNTDVEWSLGQFDEKAEYPNLLTTSHKEKSEGGLFNYLDNNKSMILSLNSWDHNHPNGATFPSLIQYEDGTCGGDMGLLQYYKSNYPNNHISYSIYTLSAGSWKYYPYYEGMEMIYGSKDTDIQEIIIYGTKSNE